MPRVFFAKSLSQWLSRLESLTACGLSGGSELGNMAMMHVAMGWPCAELMRMPRSLSQAAPERTTFSNSQGRY
jgi:hypothetical protein